MNSFRPLVALAALIILCTQVSKAQCASVSTLIIHDISSVSQTCNINGLATFTVLVDVTVSNQGNTSACFDYYNSTISTTEPQRYCWNKGTNETNFEFTIQADCDTDFILAGWSSPDGGGSQCGSTSGAATPITAPNPFEVTPVELHSFDARWQDKSILLEWISSTEENSLYYEIEKYNDFKARWDVIGIEAAAGNSMEELHYSFLDEDPAFRNMYRLKIVDADGSYEYSPVEIVARTSGTSQENEITLFPNPSNGEFHIKIDAGTAINEASLNILDINGKIVYTETVSQEIGTSQLLYLDLYHLPQGMYYYSLLDQEQVLSGRFQISR